MTRAYVLWDIDGTLLFTGRAGVYAWQDAVARVLGAERDLFAEWPFDGFTDHEIAHALSAQEGRPQEAGAVLAEYARRIPEVLHRRSGSVLPGVPEALSALAGREDTCSLLLTGNVEAGARAKLAHYDLDGLVEFDGGLCVAGADRPSIARAAIARIEQREGARPPGDRMLIVGDTPHDVACAQAVGLRSFGVATGRFSVAELERAGATYAAPAVPEPRALLELIGCGSGR